jgi:hypothetical protein
MIQIGKLACDTTLDEARDYANIIYGLSDLETKIKLKCWVHFCECRHEGGKKSISFDDFQNVANNDYYLMTLRSMLIDCSELGGVRHCIQVILRSNRLAS